MPLRLINWRLPLALSRMLTSALREPTAAGVNVTLIVQLAPAATLLPQLFVWAKSPGYVPVRLTLVMLKVAVPVLVSVTVCDALVVPKFCGLNVRLVDERLTAGVGVEGDVPPPPPPPPQAAQTPSTSSAVAKNKAAGRRRIADELRSMPRPNDPANNQSNPTGRRNLGGTLRCRAGGALLEPVVEMYSTTVAPEALFTAKE